MPHVPYAPDDEIVPEAKAVLDAFEQAYGRPSHIFRTMAHDPAFLTSAWESWNRLVVRQGTLERWVKEAVVVITCSTQQTQYCVDGHSHALRREGLTEPQVAAIQQHSFEGFSDPELSMFRFAHKAAAAPKTLEPADYQMLRDLGIGEQTILEILGVVWVNTAMNMIVDALGVVRTAEQQKELSTA